MNTLSSDKKHEIRRSAQRLANTWYPTGATLSPDAHLVAWSAQRSAKGEDGWIGGIWVAPVGRPKQARRWSHGRHDHTPRFSPCGRYLAYLSTRGDGSTPGLVVQPVEGGDAVPVTHLKRGVRDFEWAPEGLRIAYRAEKEPTDEDEKREKTKDDAQVYGERWPYAGVYLLDVAEALALAEYGKPDEDECDVEDGDASGADKKVKDKADAEPLPGVPRPLFTPERHVTGLAWSPDGTRLVVGLQPTPELDEDRHATVEIVDASSGEATRVCASMGVWNLAWSPDGTRVLWGASLLPRMQSSMTVWSAAAQERAEPVAFGSTEDSPWCVIDMRVDRQAGDVLLTLAEGVRTRVVRVSSLDSCGPMETVHNVEGDIASLDAAGGTLTLVASSPETFIRVLAGLPGQLQVHSQHHERGLEGEQPVAEELTVTAADGTELDATVVRLPSVAASGPVKTLVMPHGGPYWRTSLGVSPLAHLFASHGYVVLQPNYRGGMGRGSAFASAAVGAVGGLEWGDVMALTDAAVERGIADPNKLCLGGWSQGGYLTAWGVTHTDRFQAAVMGAGISCWHTMAMTNDVPLYEAEMVDTSPWLEGGAARAAQASPIAFADRCRTPLLILHGENDQRVPVSQARGFALALRELGREVQLVTYPREPHSVLERRHAIDLYTRWLTWLEERVG